MKNTATIIVVTAVAIAGVLGGRWWGTSQDPAATSASTQSAAPNAPRKILYYRNPMGLPDTSPVPKKDPMGMDYVPVYEGEAERESSAAPGPVKISAEKVQKLGVRTETATMRPLGRSVRASGRVEPDERRTYAITPKFEGYVERLHVNATGQPVARGQPLFEVYSPELVSAQREYAIAAQGMRSLANAGGDAAAGMRQLAESSLLRLRNWDIPASQVDALAKTGEVQRTVTFRSPFAGIVTEKKAVQGMRFMPGEVLYQVTDLSAVWVVADVFERDIGLVQPGARATVRIDAYPDKTFSGKVTYVYPTLKPDTRTIPVRLELQNPAGLLKPAMFAQVELGAGNPSPVLTVPDSAVIDSGTRKIVLVDRGDGRFEPRDVKTGSRGEQYVQVLEGLQEGERVVVAANFLIDAESNLRAAIGGLAPGGHAGHGGAAAPPAQPASSASPSQQAAAPAVGHKGQGSVEGIDAKAGTLTIQHGPIPSIRWPAMSMEFKVANPSLAQDLKPGTRVDFEFVERQPGEYVITSVKRAAGHSGH